MSEDKPQVLIVDQARFSSLITKMLSGRYESTTAVDGPAAINLLREASPDVHIADCLCRQLEYGSGGDDIIPEIDPDVMDTFSMGDRGVSILTEAAKSDLDDADSFLGALS
jgi:hypothetical protein